jgi:arylsulfatase
MNPLSIENSGIAGIASRHGYRVETLPQSLFDLDTDPSESMDVSAHHPKIVGDLLDLVETFRADLGDTNVKHGGRGCRAPGMIP